MSIDSNAIRESKCPAAWRLVQRFFQANDNGNIKALPYGPFVREIIQLVVASVHKGPVMRTAFQCHVSSSLFKGLLILNEIIKLWYTDHPKNDEPVFH